MNGEKKEKMKKFTKMLAFMLALVMIASGLPVTSAYAAETKALKQAFLVTQETASKDAKVLREKVLVVGDKVDFRFIKSETDKGPYYNFKRKSIK